MTESKKVWVEPELIVLVRSKPEEAVLISCKASWGVIGPFFMDNSCSPQGWGGCSEIVLS